MTDWSKIKHFKRTESWGDADRMNPDLILALDEFREKLGQSILVTCGTQGKHVDKSLHYEGKAVDIVFPKNSVDLLFDAWFLALRMDKFKGIGLYPRWMCNGKYVGGLHLDMREGPLALWMGTPGKLGTEYFPVNKKNLKDWMVIP